MFRLVRWLVICLAVGFETSSSAQEPLKDYVGRFAELDAQIRAIDATDVSSTNYVAWMEEAIDCKTRLKLAEEIDPWLEDLAATYSNNWKILHAVAMGYHGQQDYWQESIRLWESIQCMDRAYKLTLTVRAAENELILFRADYIWLLAENAFTEGLLPTKKTPGSLRPEGVACFDPGIPSREIIFFDLPSSYDTAANDGELIRWLIHCQPAKNPLPDDDWPKRNLSLADFALLVAGAHRNLPLDESYALDNYGWDKTVPSEAIRTILVNLKDDETVLWEANGTHRIISLPEDYRYIAAYQELVEQGDKQAADALGEIFITRCQLARAARYFELAGNTNRVQSIRANQGAFVRHKLHVKGACVAVDFMYRNGKSVSLELYRLTTESNLLARLISRKVRGVEMDLLTGDPSCFQKMEPSEQQQWIGDKINSWAVDLAPLSDHRDTIKTIEVPGLDEGTYLLRAGIEAGNRCETILHVVDTHLFCAPSREKEIYILCDAFSGKPCSGEEFHIVTTSGSDPCTVQAYTLRETDKDGLFVSESIDYSYPYILAFLDRTTPVAFKKSSVDLDVRNWKYNTKESNFITTDRPLYRPGDTGYLKLCDANRFQLDPPELSNCGYKLQVQRTGITNDQYEGQLDDFGGADYTFIIPSNAPLGIYHTGDREYSAPVTFRVEDYRTPDFDITARLTSDQRIAVQANYTYGKPLNTGLIKLSLQFIKQNDANWYPDAPFDFLWGKGYWWNGYQKVKSEAEFERSSTVEFNSISTNLNTDGTCFVDLSSLSNGLEVLQTPGFFRLEVMVSDSAKKELSKILTIPVTFPERSLCCWLDRAFYPTNQPITCQVDFEHQTLPLRLEVRNLAASNDLPLQS
ncbi:MAG: hypothetical protein FJ220_03095, partial [Kiritimatiellaceae bacterium]|nr:hypothetical protein [Kiritimatiellaceae bacterium]